MALARTPKLLLSACLLFGVAACGVDAREGAAALGAGAPAKAAAAQSATESQFGTEHRFASGITISVSAPQSFKPSAAAYPRSQRAASFDIEVTNNGADAYKLSGLAVTASISGRPAKQVVDATQGLNGIFDAGKDLQSGRTARMTLAFAVPEQTTQLKVLLRPSAAEPGAVTYGGAA
ncbi:hypothetical protein [Amycolatopsis sp. PS_44_ISF1]|uniref:hypothetical protein n=1 Tax=Amycolatopsis sp. PS_44_ISF1 TaxID=2974917 RepID=UPI0028DEC362|nr:hypothetical protein [Amycolatopsis sp. PS_44_ISF1]MDT8911736.1 hypothetical protein [Amycolatopsis sp. PS_44_ISF1]